MQATYGNLKRKSSKLHKIKVGKLELIIGMCGAVVSGYAMLEWIKKGRKPDDFPFPIQQNPEMGSRTIVGEVGTGKIYYYDQFPVAVPILDPFGAWGAGEDFALGALALNATAREAVEIACRFSVNCGLGIEEYSLFD
jgi:ATP-dependent protease HslVU (ClpYQ) peptidase subunit